MSETSISRRDAIIGAVAAAAATTAIAGTAEARQPNMEAALASLRSARDSLERAQANKGGHRRRAIDLINQAISEVRQGIQHADA
jgi:hypothetical protein